MSPSKQSPPSFDQAPFNKEAISDLVKLGFDDQGKSAPGVFMNNSHVILVSTTGYEAEFISKINGLIERDNIEHVLPEKTISKVTSSMDTTYLGKGFIASTAMMDTLIKGLNSGGFEPDTIMIKTGQNDGMVMPSIIEARNTITGKFRVGAIAPRVFDEDDSEYRDQLRITKAFNDFDSIINMKDTCTPDAVKTMTEAFKSIGFTTFPVNVLSSKEFKPLSKKEREKMEGFQVLHDFRSAINNYPGIELHDDVIDKVARFNGICSKEKPEETEDCTKKACFVPYYRKSKDGIIVSSEMLAKAGDEAVCFAFKEKRYPRRTTKKSMNSVMRIMSKLSGIPVKDFKDEGIACLNTTNEYPKSWEVMVRVGDRIVGYDGTTNLIKK